jgi:hypothetical protein
MTGSAVLVAYVGETFARIVFYGSRRDLGVQPAGPGSNDQRALSGNTEVNA